MRLQVRVVWDFAATGFELDRVKRIEWQPRQLGEAAGERRLAAAGIAEHGDFPHGG
jgi:hypothetical protein